MPKQYIEILVALLIAIISAWGMTDAAQYPGESSYVPVVVLSLSILLSVVWIGQTVMSLRHCAETLSINRLEMVRFVIFVSIAIIYGCCFYLIGFFTSTLFMVPIAATLLGYRQWKVLIPTSIVFLIILNLVFSLMLKTPLPPELLFRLKDLF